MYLVASDRPSVPPLTAKLFDLLDDLTFWNVGLEHGKVGIVGQRRRSKGSKVKVKFLAHTDRY